MTRMTRLRCQLLLLLLLGVTLTRAGCPGSGWVQAHGRCFLYLPYPRPFPAMLNSDAQTACHTIQPGSVLPSVHSLAEANFLWSLTGKRTDFVVWLGLTNTTGRAWRWADGSATDYFNWHENNPRNYRCVFMTPSLKWNDVGCTGPGEKQATAQVICQYHST